MILKVEINMMNKNQSEVLNNEFMRDGQIIIKPEPIPKGIVDRIMNAIIWGDTKWNETKND